MTNENCVQKVMCKAICFTVIASSICFFISTAWASEANKHESHTIEERPAVHLSHDLKVIFNQEMNEIKQATMKIIPAISAGNWENITEIAKNIKNSFILKQKLTEKQIEELHHSGSLS